MPPRRLRRGPGPDGLHPASVNACAVGSATAALRQSGPTAERDDATEVRIAVAAPIGVPFESAR